MMQRLKPLIFLCLYLILIVLAVETILKSCKEIEKEAQEFPIMLDSSYYRDSNLQHIWSKFIYRAQAQPFNVISLTIFVLAIIHTFSSKLFTTLSNTLRAKEGSDTFLVELLRFMGEVEVVFGFWVIPLIALMSYFYGWAASLYYLNSRSYAEPIFVVVVMIIASTHPILNLVERALKFMAKLGKESVTAWWWCLLSVGPILGSFITEPGAMTVCALLLSKKCFSLKLSKKLSYTTLALLFVNVSVGGVLTCFAAPPVLMVSRVWEWNSLYMLTTFGYKAVIGIFLGNLFYYFFFRKELKSLDKQRLEMEAENIGSTVLVPRWICLIHIFFLAWIVIHACFPVIVIGSFLLFLGFYQATAPYQSPLNLKTPILVGFFLGGLVVHGGLQGWWISPLIGGLNPEILLVISAVLTAFNDNAEITYLSTLITNLSDEAKYAIIAGAVSGGGLTVIANAPNPAGQALLSPYFSNGVSPIKLFKYALPPTVIVTLTFYLMRGL
ncbi:MAG: putative Na+/H+ antiporter [Chlamydiales bacterium]